MSDYLDINNEELLKDFFSEAEQQVENLESNILVIENDPTNHEAIDEIFRAAHTLKGGSATVEMTELSTFTHAVEDVLDELRSDAIPVTEDVVDVLLSSIDVIKAMLEARANGSIYEEDVEPLKSKLHAFTKGSGSKKDKGSKSSASKAAAAAAAAQFMPSAAPKPAAPLASAPAPGGIPESFPSPATYLSEYDLLELKQICASGEKLWGVTVLFDEANPMNSVGGIQVFAALKERGNILKTIPDFEQLYEDEFHAQVVYFISSSSTGEQLEDTGFLDDVVIAIDAQNLSEAVAGGTPAPAVKPAATPSAPPPVASVPEPEPVVQTQNAAGSAALAPKAAKAPSDDGAKAAPKKAGAPAASHGASTGSVLRVDSKRIDYLLNLVSETVIAKAAFNQNA